MPDSVFVRVVDADCEADGVFDCVLLLVGAAGDCVDVDVIVTDVVRDMVRVTDDDLLLLLETDAEGDRCMDWIALASPRNEVNE